ncbi:MAG: hypothetical protein J7513_14570 [Solirubrobacteraceae bacterium]|nr:hypothetical protein [Solirubrobacteraceae bacterium]
MINAIISDLVEKKLWPLALFLVVCAVGAPMMLSRPGEPPVAEAVPQVDAGADEGPQLALSRTTTTGFARAPRVNKKALDPFGDRTEAKTDAIVKQVQDSIKNALGGIDTAGSAPVTTPGTSEDPGITPVKPGSSDEPKDTTPKTETDDVLSVLITVGTSEPTQLDDVRTLSPLPDAENPFLVYVGKTSSGGASFLVSADVVPTGDGVCDPSPTDCRTLTMKSGDTESFKLVDGSTVEVTMIGVDTKKVPVTGTAAKAARLEAKAREVGIAALKSVLDDKQVMYSLGRHKVKYRF